MGSEMPQVSEEEFAKIYRYVIANGNSALMEEQERHESRQEAIRNKLKGHWSDDDCRNCTDCQERKSYTHGVFGFLHPAFPPTRITIDEARSRAEPASRKIWADYEQLKAIIERYEPLIHKRWTKKSNTKRRQAVQSAWTATSNPPPQPMAEMHRPDVHYLRSLRGIERVCYGGDPVEEDKRHLFFWPRLNLEDLADKLEPLLLVLNARGRHSPPTFAFADLQPLLFGLRIDRLHQPPYLDMYSMAFTGQESPGRYGQLVSWEEHPEAYRRLHMGRDTSPGEGLWILEVQERLYRFLVNMCRIILHDQRVDDRVHLLAQPVAPEPPLPTANGSDSDIGTSLMVTRDESAYHVPAKLDIRRLQNLVESKLAEAEDSLWALREDPDYFATALKETYQSRPEQLLDTANKRHPSVVEPEAKRKFMADIVGMVWRQHITAVERWALFFDKVSHLADLKERLFDNASVPIRPEDDLPPELAFAIYDLLHRLQRLLAVRLCNVWNQACCSPPQQHLYRRKPLSRDPEAQPDERLDWSSSLVPSDVRLSGELLELSWILHRMSMIPCRKTFGLHNCIEDIERITRDRKVRKLISSTQAADLSEYTILSECIRQLELFQPWAATFEAGMAAHQTVRDLEHQYAATFFKQGLLFKWAPSATTCALGATLGKMRYPVDKVPTKGNIDAMREAESVLDAFWDAALSELQAAGHITERLSKILLDNDTTPQRTPMWVEHAETEEEEEEGAAAAEATQDDEKVTLARPFQGDLGSSTQAASTKFKPQEPRVKIKSRGVARSSAVEPEAMGPPPPPPIVLEVDHRALKTLEMLFYRPAPGSSQGEIPWTEVTYAMHNVGFGVEKLGGSSWQFTPGPLLAARGYTRGIQMHEPHPKSKVAFVVARRYGRRLARTYGWSADVFRLRSA